MNLSKMKKLFPLFLVMISIGLTAQIPDSLDVELPWEHLKTQGCTATMGEGPRSDNENVYIALESDEVFYNEYNYCGVRLRNWVIVDWQGNAVYEYLQYGDTSPEANTYCENEIYLHYDDFPITLTPEDLLFEVDPSHTYSFDFANVEDQAFDVDGSSDESFVLFVYDFTDSTVCKSNIYVTRCNDEIELVFPESTEVEFNGEYYIELTLEMLGISIDYPCGNFATEILVANSNNNRLLAFTVGDLVPVRINVNFSDGSKVSKVVNVYASGIKPEPKVMYIEEKSFSAGETVELEVWSEGIPGLIAWQILFEFNNAEVLSLEETDMFEQIAINIKEDGSDIRFLWTPKNSLSLDAEFNETWFKIVLEAKVDGTTQDIFVGDSEGWSSIVVEDDNYLYDFKVEFEFNIESRNILSSNASIDVNRLEIYPNPVNNELTISGLDFNKEMADIEIFDLQGRRVHKEKIQSHRGNQSLDITHLPSGIFFLQIANGKQIVTQKISKI